MRSPTHEASLGFLLLVAFSVKIAAPRTCRPTDDASHRLLPALRPTTEEPPANVAAWGEQLVFECLGLTEKTPP